MDFVAEPLREPGKPAFGSGWFSSNAIGTPTRRRPAGCCARTVSGHAVSRSGDCPDEVTSSHCLPRGLPLCRRCFSMTRLQQGL
jgi:hypothetical protein